MYLRATSDENAKEAVALLGDHGRVEEVEASCHDFHSRHVFPARLTQSGKLVQLFRMWKNV